MSKLLTFTVEGTGPFPLDMLRYDQCWPKTQHDVSEMGRTYNTRKIALETWRVGPTVDRWKSFGWSVV